MNSPSFANGSRIATYDPNVTPQVPPLKTLVERYAARLTRPTTAEEIAGHVGADRVRVREILDDLTERNLLARSHVNRRVRGRVAPVRLYCPFAIRMTNP